MTREDDDYTARTEAFLDCLRTRRDPQAAADALPDLLASLSYTLDDEGHALERVRERWLREGDLDRTRLAFAMDYVFPGRSRAEIIANVSAAARRFPQFAEQANAIVELWDAGSARRGQAGADPEFWTLGWAPAPPMSLREAMEFLAEHPAPKAPPKFLAEILDELLPCLTPEAQAELHAAADAWAAGPDSWRAAIAAWMQVPAPGRTQADLAERRAEVIARHPRAAFPDREW